MFCRHVFGNISGGFRGNTWISRVRDRVKYQKPCWAKKALRITFSLNSTHLIRTPISTNAFYDGLSVQINGVWLYLSQMLFPDSSYVLICGFVPWSGQKLKFVFLSDCCCKDYSTSFSGLSPTRPASRREPWEQGLWLLWSLQSSRSWFDSI